MQQWDITIGQIYRNLTHVKKFQMAVTRPRQVQEEKLLAMVKANSDTLFGRRHNFAAIKSIADYQRFVPPAEYEDLRPYIEASMRGERAQLTATQPFMYATTSGTTSLPKFVPITKEHIDDYTHAFQLHNYQIIEDHPLAAIGKFFIVSSDDQVSVAQDGSPCGAISGLLNRKQSPIVKAHFALPYEVCKIKDVNSKYYMMLRAALVQDVTVMLCCNPSSLLLLAEQLAQNADSLIKDIFDGTINSAFLPEAHLRGAFDRYTGNFKERARLLAKVVEKEGVLKPKDAWPRLALLSCWKGGPMPFYLEKLPEYYGDLPVRDFGYMASEGRGTVPMTSEGAGGVAALTSHFFEFVPEDQMEKSTKSYLTLDELELGRRYFIHFTTRAGLYRYNINDLVEVIDFYQQTPVLKFVRKGAGVSSITGEKLTEDQVNVALCFAVNQLNLHELQYFTAAVELDQPPYYACYAELRGRLSEPVKNEFLRIFDQSLQFQNSEYQDKRHTKRLGMPTLEIVPPGTYARLRQQRVQEGAPEAQVKIPLLSCRTDFGPQLLALSAR
jgi:hypothetical protein